MKFKFKGREDNANVDDLAWFDLIPMLKKLLKKVTPINGKYREVVLINKDGDAEPNILGWAQFSDQPTPPDFPNGIFTGTNFKEDGSADFGFLELSLNGGTSVAKPNSIPLYNPGTIGTGGGTLPVQDAIEDGDATNLKQVIDLIGKSGGGTVTSVGVVMPTGFSVSNSPVTSSGAIGVAFATGYQGYQTSEATKLAGIAAGAQVNVATNLAQGTRTTTTVPITSSTGTSATLSEVTTTLAGVMSSADKVKLNTHSVITDGEFNAAVANTERTVSAVSLNRDIRHVNNSKQVIAIPVSRNLNYPDSGEDKITVVSGASEVVLTLNNDATVAWVGNCVINIANTSTVNCPITLGASVVCYSVGDNKKILPNGRARLEKIGANTWILSGDLIA